MEKLEERYLKWTLGVDSRTPGYLLREELQRDKLRGRMGSRAWGYERRLEREGGNGSEGMLGGDEKKSKRRKRGIGMGRRERKILRKQRN